MRYWRSQNEPPRMDQRNRNVRCVVDCDLFHLEGTSMSNDTPTPPVTPEMIAVWQTWLEVLVAGGGDSQDREDLLASFGRFALEHSPALLSTAADAQALQGEVEKAKGRAEMAKAVAEQLRENRNSWRRIAEKGAADVARWKDAAKAALAERRDLERERDRMRDCYKSEVLKRIELDRHATSQAEEIERLRAEVERVARLNKDIRATGFTAFRSEPGDGDVLPTWSECNRRICNEDWREKYGHEHDIEELPTPLHRFIHEYEDCDPVKAAHFRELTQALVSYVQQATRQMDTALARPASGETVTVEGWTGRKCTQCNGTGEFGGESGRNACNGCGGTGEEYGLIAAPPAAGAKEA